MTRGLVVLVVLWTVVALCANAIPSPFDTTQGGCVSEKISSNKPDGGELQAEVIYNNIVQGTYPHAVRVARDLHNSGKGSVLRSVALRLAREGNKNLVNYVYMLWSGSDRDIIDYMPDSLKSIFNGPPFILKSKKFGSTLKLSESVDSDGDRTPLADARNHTSFIKYWDLMPYWENNQAYFRIRNPYHNMYLKLAASPDDNGDRKAYGSNSSELPSTAWILEPLVIGDDVYFYIINAKFNQGLELQQSTDEVGVWRLWGRNGNIRHDPLSFAWSIRYPSVVS